MTTPEIRAVLALVRERWTKLFPRDSETACIASYAEPFFLRDVGLVARVNLYSKESYSGPTRDLLVVPLARMHEPMVVLDELDARLQALEARGIASALSEPLGETLGLVEVRYHEGMFAPDEDTARRRKEALALMDARFDAVAARMKEVYGLRLPRYMATFAAFWRSLGPLERKGMDYIGRSPGGIMVWFEDDGLQRETRDGLDPRLECRFRADPPELVTFMWGDSDGLHYGLWYDDPADLPTYVAHNYARDSAETWPDDKHTPLEILRKRIQDVSEEGAGNPEDVPISVHAAREALDAFADADRAALAADPPAARWLNADRIPTLGTFGPALPPGAGSIRVGDPHKRHEAWRTQGARVQKWIASAKRDCAEGKPAAALTFGLDLHWLDTDEHREDALALLVMAYEKLGRHAHAETAKVHHAHRDLGSVSVFLSAPERPEGGESGEG